MAKIKILYIDEEQNNLNAFYAFFRRKEAFSVKCSLSIKEMTKHLEQYFHVLIIDHSILEEIGLNFCQNPSLEKTSIIAVSARQSFEILEIATSSYSAIPRLLTISHNNLYHKYFNTFFPIVFLFHS